MIIEGDTQVLKDALDNPEWILLLLCGPKDSTASQIHEYLGDDGLEEWHKYFLITDTSVLDQGQPDDWFEGADTDRYAVLTRAVPKTVAASGPVTDLMRKGRPSMSKILLAFTKGRGGDR